MTDPQLFGRPSANGLPSWPPAATPTASTLARLEQPSARPRIRLDWKFFAVAAVLVALAVAMLFAASAAIAAPVSAAGRPSAGVAIAPIPTSSDG